MNGGMIPHSILHNVNLEVGPQSMASLRSEFLTLSETPPSSRGVHRASCRSLGGITVSCPSCRSRFRLNNTVQRCVNQELPVARGTATCITKQLWATLRVAPRKAPRREQGPQSMRHHAWPSDVDGMKHAPTCRHGVVHAMSHKTQSTCTGSPMVYQRQATGDNHLSCVHPMVNEG
jgi:hypothetical protein